jgi:hypothetical protein
VRRLLSKASGAEMTEEWKVRGKVEGTWADWFIDVNIDIEEGELPPPPEGEVWEITFKRVDK